MPQYYVMRRDCHTCCILPSNLQPQTNYEKISDNPKWENSTKYVPSAHQNRSGLENKGSWRSCHRLEKTKETR